MVKKQYLKFKIDWGFSPDAFVFLIMLAFVPMAHLIAEISYTIQILSIVCFVLLVGVLTGSKIKLFAEQKDGE